MDYEFEGEYLLRLWHSDSRTGVIMRLLMMTPIRAMIVVAHMVNNLALHDPGSQDEFLEGLHDASVCPGRGR